MCGFWEKERNVLCLWVSMLPRSHLEYWAESWTLLLIHFHFFLRWPRPARPHHGYICFSLWDEGRRKGEEEKSGSYLKQFLHILLVSSAQLSWNWPRAMSFTAVVSRVTLPWGWQLWCRPSRGKSVFDASHWTSFGWLCGWRRASVVGPRRRWMLLKQPVFKASDHSFTVL